MLNILAGLIGGAAQAIGTNSAAKAQQRALSNQNRVTTKWALAGRDAQQAAARRAGDWQVNGYRDANTELSRAGDQAVNVLQGGVDAARSAYQPAMDLGQWGAGQMRDHLSGKSNYTGSAAYKFLQSEMSDALQAAQAKNGQLFSGATGDALIRRTHDLGALDEQQYFNNLYNSTAMGQNAIGQFSNLDAAARSGIANTNMGVGQARAGNIAAAGNARAQQNLNIGNAAANAASTIGGTAGNIAGQRGDVAAAGRIGVGNAFSGAMDNVLGAWQYNQTMGQYPNYYGSQTSASGAPTTSPVPWASPFQQRA